MNRSILVLAGLLVASTPFAAAPAHAVPVSATQVQQAQAGMPSDLLVPAQFVVRERRYERGYDRGPRWRAQRRWDGYTGQVCRSRVVVGVNRFGVRERRVIRTCR